MLSSFVQIEASDGLSAYVVHTGRSAPKIARVATTQIVTITQPPQQIFAGACGGGGLNAHNEAIGTEDSNTRAIVDVSTRGNSALAI